METETRLKCTECEAVVEVGEEGPALYECGDCGTVFNRDNSSDGISNRCPDCNKFASKIADSSCPDCEEGQLEEIQVGVDEDGEVIDPDDLAQDDGS